MILLFFARAYVLCLGFFVFLNTSWAENVLEEVTVEADFAGDNPDLTREENLKDPRHSTFQQVIRGGLGVQTDSSGAFGQQVFASVRGASTDHTAVLMDGVSAKSAVELGRFDFSKVSLDDFESVNLQAGPYGSGNAVSPIGGLFSLKTKRGRGKPHLMAKSDVGSLRTASFYTSLSGEQEASDFYFGASFRRSGEGRRNRFLGENSVSDEGFLKSATANMGHFFTEALEGRLILSTNYLDAFVDDFQGGVPVFSGHRQRTRFDRFAPQLIWSPSEQWRHELNLSYMSTDLSYRSQAFYVKNHSHTKGITYNFEWRPQERFHVLAGYEGTSETLKSNQAASRDVAYHRFLTGLKTHLGSSWFVEGRGVSHHHRHAGDHLTLSGKVGYAWNKNFSIFAKGGQGLKLPTLIDIYGSPPFQQPNLTIRPEKSIFYEAGFMIQDIEKKNHVQISAYQNTIRNFIVAQRGAMGVYTTRNEGKKRLEGIEFKATVSPFDKIFLNLGYTYTRSLPQEGTQRTIRLARHKVVTSLNYNLFDEGEIFVGATYKSRRQDLDFSNFPASIVDLGAYTTVRAGIDYRVTKKLQCFGRIENAFNARYEDVFGYGARGREILVGLKVTT